MHNVLIELDRLRFSLKSKGLESHTVDIIVEKASQEIQAAFIQQADAAMQQAIEAGVNLESADFINELRLDLAHMTLVTDSGNTDFSEPPRPMLPQLLKNAKPMKDGSGVYKVIPVGEGSKKKPVATNIYDAYKQISAERLENAQKQYAAISPKGSRNTKFRTATSKQDASTKWVQPAKNKDFTDEVRTINNALSDTMEVVVRDIIRSYEEAF